jgi:hypothetical protein
MPLTLEYDDFPRECDHFLKMVDWLRERHQGFKCTAFAIPAEMKAEHWREVDKRRDYLRVGAHGFKHLHWECTEPSSYEPKLNKLCSDGRWTPLFKAPWYEYTPEFIQALHNRGWAFALKSMHPIPYPAPKEWRCWDRWYWAARDGEACHIRTHPRRGVRKRLRRSHTLSEDGVGEWAESWRGWIFATELLTRVKSNCDVSIDCNRQTARYDVVHCDYASVDIAKALHAVRPGGEVRLDVPFTRPLRVACEVLGVSAVVENWPAPYVVLRGPPRPPPLAKTTAILKKWLRR